MNRDHGIGAVVLAAQQALGLCRVDLLLEASQTRVEIAGHVLAGPAHSTSTASRLPASRATR